MPIIDQSTINNLNTGSTDNPAQIATQINGVMSKVLSEYILPIAAFVILLFGIYGGVLYFTAYGSEEKANKGKMTILWAVIGALVVAAAWLMVTWWTGSINGVHTAIPGAPAGVNDIPSGINF